MKQARYYLTITSFMLAGLVCLQLWQWTILPKVEISSDDIAWFTPPAIYFLSLPAAFIFWIHSLNDEQVFILRFSRLLAVISASSYLGAAWIDLATHAELVIGLTLLGCLAGAFVFIPFRQFMRHAFRDRRRAIIALLAASSSALYKLSDFYLWKRMCFSAAIASNDILQTLGIDVRVVVGMNRASESAITMVSDHFSLNVYRPCSGLEAIYLFVFLFSIVAMLDWKIIKKINLIETYLIGFIYMYVVNLLRIISLFILGHFANAPDASPFIASMRGLPVHIFHSYVGQIYYFLAFMVFSTLLYAYITPARNTK